MKVVELLEKRHVHWRELETLCGQLESRRAVSLGAEGLTRFASLYRSACADLALADTYQLPPDTVRYLHQLVGRAHNLLYRNRKFDFGAWLHELVHVVPQRLLQDNCFRLAFVLFWGMFLLSSWLAATSPRFAELALGKENQAALRDMYNDALAGNSANVSSFMGAYYINHNAGIGLKCFVAGAALAGIGGMFVTTYNAYFLGAAFGYMYTVPQRDNFFEFVMAHGPFELTAIVLSAAAGMRVGFATIYTRGLSRSEAWPRAAKEAFPMIMAAVLLFVGAAFIEGFISPSGLLPWWFKALVCLTTSGLLMFYFVLLGWPRGSRSW
jgi:uncharacterized membrane protein SpoIIM required for sporulation